MIENNKAQDNINYFFKTFEQNIATIINKNEKNKNEAYTKDYDNTTIKLLIDIVHNFDMWFNCISIKLLIESDPNNKKSWGKIKQILLKKKDDFYNNKQLKHIIKELNIKYASHIAHGDDNNVIYSTFLNKINLVFEKIKYNNNDLMEDKINELYKIINKLIKVNVNNVSSISNDATSDKSATPNRFVLESNYFNYIAKYKDQKLLEQINNVYIKRCNNLLKNLSDLIILRHNKAIELKRNTFFHMINYGKYSTESENTQNLISDLIEELNKNLNYNFKKEMQTMAVTINKNNVKLSDILYYKNNLIQNIKFKLVDILNFIFKIILTYFEINIVKYEEVNSNTKYKCYNKEKLLICELSLDLEDKPNKKYTQTPILIKLSDKYSTNNEEYPMKLYMLASHKKDINFNEIVLLFKEFGYLVKYSVVSSDNKYEFSNFMPQLMEAILYQDDVLLKLCNNNNANIYTIIKRYLEFDKYLSLKIKYTTTAIDNKLHGDYKFIKSLTEEQNEMQRCIMVKNEIDTIINDWILIQSPSGLTLQDFYFYVIIPLVNGNEGITYNNIMEDILSHAIININNYKEFKEKVLIPTNKPFSKLLKEFVCQYYENPYEIYLDEVVLNKKKNKKNTLTENQKYIKQTDTSCFNDVSDTEA